MRTSSHFSLSRGEGGAAALPGERWAGLSEEQVAEHSAAAGQAAVNLQWVEGDDVTGDV